MPTTTAGKAEDARAHCGKFAGFLLTEGAGRLQQNMWFVAKSLRLMGKVKEADLMRFNSLLKAGAFADAALLLKPPGTYANLLEAGDGGWIATVITAGDPRRSKTVKAGAPGAALLGAFAALYLEE